MSPTPSDARPSEFPIQGSRHIKSIPWAAIAAHERTAQKNFHQSLARLAERGGLSVREALVVLKDGGHDMFANFGLLANDHAEAELLRLVAPTRVDEAPEGEPDVVAELLDAVEASGARMTFTPTPEQPAVTGEPTCPTCSKPLEEVRYRGGYLNRDQWESVRAGDWWCETCPSNGRGRSGAYYWSREVLSTLDPVSRTLGATDSPREDSTDVSSLTDWMPDNDALAELLTCIENYWRQPNSDADGARGIELAKQIDAQLSSTRTAFQRVREAAAALSANATRGQWNHTLDERTMIVRLSDFDALRALTSTETDQ